MTTSCLSGWAEICENRVARRLPHIAHRFLNRVDLYYEDSLFPLGTFRGRTGKINFLWKFAGSEETTFLEVLTLDYGSEVSGLKFDLDQPTAASTP